MGLDFIVCAQILLWVPLVQLTEDCEIQTVSFTDLGRESNEIGIGSATIFSDYFLKLGAQHRPSAHQSISLSFYPPLFQHVT